MNAEPAIKARSASNRTIAILFVAMLWLPMIGSIFRADNALLQVDEKRALAQFPDLKPGWAGARGFLAGVNQYYDDHFGFRKRLIHWQQNWKRNWLQENNIGQVAIGANGWLFNSDETVDKNCRATNPFTDERLAQWRALLEQRRDWLARRGIRYIFVVAPCKHTIYPELLPEWMQRVGPATRLDQFVDYMKQHSTVEIADERPALLEGKKTRQIYFASDTHWNELGAFMSCEELIRNLSRQMPGLRTLPVTAFRADVTNEAGGNLAQLLAAADSIRETNSPRLRPLPPLQPLKMTRNIRKNEIFMESANPQAKGEAMIFGDSFAESWFPFIGYHFNRVTLHRIYDQSSDRPGGNIGHRLDLKIIEREKPDVLIDEILEEWFWKEDPEWIKFEKDFR